MRCSFARNDRHNCQNKQVPHLAGHLRQERPRTLLHTALLSLTSSLTSLVCIIFFANLRISFTAKGARFLKHLLCSFLCRLMVYSRVTASLERLFLSTICTPRPCTNC